MKVRAVLAATLLFLAGCARYHNADLSSVTITGDTCANCLSGVSIDRNGRVEDLSERTAPKLRYALAARTMLDALPLQEFDEAARAKYAISTPTSVVIVTATFRDGHFERAAVPLEGGAGLLKLGRWAELTAFEATNALQGGRRAAIASAFEHHRIRSIALRMYRCFGECPAYEATFSSSGTATIDDLGLSCKESSRAAVPFEHVLQAAALARISSLRERYPAFVSDAAHARITITTADARYTSDGPSSSASGREFLALQSRLDQLVRDTAWSPQIHLERCARVPPAKAFVGSASIHR